MEDFKSDVAAETYDLIEKMFCKGERLFTQNKTFSDSIVNALNAIHDDAYKKGIYATDVKD